MSKSIFSLRTGSSQVRSLAVAMITFFALVLGVNGQTVAGRIGDGTVTRGKTATAAVTLEIPSELHTNSNRPSEPNLIPTTVKVTANGLTTSAVRYPAGKDRKFDFAAKPLNVYEGKVDFTFLVVVPKAFTDKEVSVDVAVRYQACTTEVCYPPKTKTVTLTAAVK